MKGKDKNIIIYICASVFIFIFLVLGIVGIIYNNKQKKEKKYDNENNNNPVDVEDNYIEIEVPKEAKKFDIKKVGVKDLSTKIEKLNFEDRLSTSVGYSNYDFSGMELSENDVVLKIINSLDTREFRFAQFCTIKSMAIFELGVGESSFILCDDGSLYESVDIVDVFKDNADYKPTYNQVLVPPIVSMASGDKSFKLNDKYNLNINNLYLKTIDNRIFTNENMLNGEKQDEFVEVYDLSTEVKEEKKVEESSDKKDNTKNETK